MRNTTISIVLLALAGCGSITYDEPGSASVVVTTRGGGNVSVLAESSSATGHSSAHVSGAGVYCGGNQSVRLTNETLDGQGGPAVIASGNCVVEISESIVRGAVLARDNATVRLVECRIQGDLSATGNANIDTPGSRHEGQRLAL